jgi:hypothetical protein
VVKEKLTTSLNNFVDQKEKQEAIVSLVVLRKILITKKQTISSQSHWIIDFIIMFIDRQLQIIPNV